jgi:hypothetical protein
MAQACWCEEFQTPLEALEAADGVFYGTVLSAYVDPVDSEDWVTEIEVQECWKGIGGGIVYLRRPYDSFGWLTDCKPSFSVNESYLIFAGLRTDGFYSAYECSRTTHADFAGPIMAELPEPFCSAIANDQLSWGVLKSQF